MKRQLPFGGREEYGFFTPPRTNTPNQLDIDHNEHQTPPAGGNLIINQAAPNFHTPPQQLGMGIAQAAPNFHTPPQQFGMEMNFGTPNGAGGALIIGNNASPIAQGFNSPDGIDQLFHDNFIYHTPEGTPDHNAGIPAGLAGFYAQMGAIPMGAANHHHAIPFPDLPDLNQEGGEEIIIHPNGFILDPFTGQPMTNLLGDDKEYNNIEDHGNTTSESEDNDHNQKVSGEINEASSDSDDGDLFI